MHSVLNTLSEYTFLYMKKHFYITFLHVLKIVENVLKNSLSMSLNDILKAMYYLNIMSVNCQN